jgi:hypothetical protein
VIFINGKQRCLLIGVDHPTQDLVHALVLPVENSDGFARLETEVRLDAGYPLLGGGHAWRIHQIAAPSAQRAVDGGADGARYPTF